MNLEQTKINRYKFLKCMYDESNASEHFIMDMWEIGKLLKLNNAETAKIVDYLKGEYLLKFMSAGGGIGITHEGIKEIEDTIENPSEKTEHFPSYIVNTINVFGDINNSNVEQGALNMSKEINVVFNLFETEIKKEIPDKLKLKEYLKVLLEKGIETLPEVIKLIIKYFDKVI